MSTSLHADLDLTYDESNDLERLRSGRDRALAEYFLEMHPGLKRMVRFRLDRRLARRIDPSDVVQEAYVEARKRLESYLDSPQTPPAAWVRRLVRQIISRIQRDNLDAKCRDVRREMNATPFVTTTDIEAISASMTPPERKAERSDNRHKLLEILGTMPPLEREILTLVHFEGRTVREAAAELDINLEAAKKRYRRAILRLKGWVSD